MLDFDRPGLQCTYEVDGSAAPIGWGVINGGGGFVVTNGVAVNDDNSDFLRYNTTKNGSVTVEALSSTSDWVCTMQWQTDASVPASTIFELSGPSGDLVRVAGGGSVSNYVLQGGNGGGNYVQIGGSIIVTAGVLNKLTAHYKATNGLIDFWVNSNLFAENFQSRAGTYNPNFIQIRGGNHVATIDLFDNIIIAPTNAPPPPSLPEPQLLYSRPGLHADFQLSTDAGEWGTRIFVDDFGISGGKAVNTSSNATLRYNTTWGGTESSALLSTNEDWACTMEWETTGEANGVVVFELGGPGGDLARLIGTGIAGQYAFHGGNGGGSYVQIGANISFASNTPHQLTCHYDTSAGLLQFWVGTNLVRSDFQSRSGTYEVDFIQLRGGADSPATDMFDDLTIGPVGVDTNEPGPRFGEIDPALVVDYNTDGNDFPTNWGVRVTAGGGWSVTNGVATSISSNSFLRYSTTPAGTTNIVALDSNRAWAASLRWTTHVSTNGSTVFELTGPGVDLARFTGTGTPGMYILQGGNGGGSYVQVGNVFNLSTGVTYLITVHYQPGTGLLDFWLDGTLVRSNFMAKNDTYTPDFIQLRGGAIVETVDEFDDVRMGYLEVASNEYRFVDVTAAVIPALTDDGVAWGDYNNDDYPDLLADGFLFLNNGGTNFSQLFMNTMGKGVWGDYNNDGYLDIFSWQLGGKLYRNLSGTGTFSDEPFPALPTSSDFIETASWIDLNGDGYVDLSVPGYESAGLNGEPDGRYLNQTGSSFVLSYTEPAPERNTRGTTSCDFDQDGDQDLYLSHYRLQPNYLWLNDGTGGLTEVGATYGVDGFVPDSINPDYDFAHTIGSAWGDLDCDGYFDLFVGNFAHPTNHFGVNEYRQPESQFLQNMGPGGNYHFTNRSDTAGLHYQESYATPALADYDNDGDLDLYLTVANPGADRSVLYRNDGNWQFTDVTAQEGLDGIGGQNYQAAWGDYDDDGDMDLITGGILFQNQGGSNNWIQIRLSGEGQAFNRAAIGAQIRIKVGGKTITRQVEGGTGSRNQNMLRVHAGLGGEAGPVDIEIIWPDGSLQIVENMPVNQVHQVKVPHLKFSSIDMDGSAGKVMLGWDALSNRVYALDRRTNLMGGTVTTVDGSIDGVAPMNTYTDNVTGIDQGFYSLRDLGP